ncbi:MAG: tRNA uridine-5-carboxymethylaminomethyl(34) synthesis enzyme MnmG, partial [Proteobacteria bacterium]|nr:tRNA uridine-5-carboxymethylaminomethyl(34) synthesis enzyme MnmG [Pseudomonadota bacterium]
IPVNRDGRRRTMLQLFTYPEVDDGKIAAIWPEWSAWPAHVREQVEIAGRYAGYMERMNADVAAFRRDEGLALPDGVDFAAIGGLSAEMKEKLLRHRPATLGQAARIPGVTPAALQALLAHVRRRAA